MTEHRAMSLDLQTMPDRRADFCSLSQCRRIAAMLDRDPASVRDGDILPCGWHFPLLAGDTRRSELRADGFPGFGLPMPDLGFPRLLLLGRTIEFHHSIAIGSDVERISEIKRLQPKETAAGPSAIVTLRHAFHPEQMELPAIVETQTYMLFGETRRSDVKAKPQPLPPHELSRVVIPDETMLFQYSALGFNSHKIHLDRTYAREVEGLPDLVVNGGLVTLLLIEFLRSELGGAPKQITTRHTAPLFCNRPATLTATRLGDVVHLSAFDDSGILAAAVEAHLA